MSKHYPAFLNLHHRRCIVVGGGSVAQAKAQSLMECGANVTMVSPTLTDTLASAATQGTIQWVRRPYQAGDLAQAFLAIAATDNRDVNQHVARDARGAGILVNVVDDPANCDFIAPAVIQRGDLTIAISTGGKSPAMARKVREHLEESLPAVYGDLLETVSEVRQTVRKEGTRAAADVWQAAISPAIVDMVKAGNIQEAKDRLLRTLRGNAHPSKVRKTQ